MPTIDKDSVTIFLSIAAIILYFSGFHYINEYFRFFGLIGRYREFDLAQLAFFSFSVIYGLFSFKDWIATLLFVGGTGAVIWVATSGRVAKVAGRLNASWAVSAIRWAAAIAITFIVIFQASGRIGYADGCGKLIYDGKVVRLLDLDTSKIPADIRPGVGKLNTESGFILLWEGEHAIDLVKREASCDVEQLQTFTISRDLFKTIVVAVNHSGG